MAGFWARVKNWIGTENLTYLDLNAEINNIAQKVGADTVSGANSTNGTSPTVAAMQATENPGTVGSEVLAKTIQDDIQQLRYQMNALIGGAQWYSSPVQSIASLNGLINGVSYVPNNRIISGRKDANDQPMFLVPSGSADTITLKATTTNLSTYINGTAYTFASDLTITSLSVAPSSNNTCLVNDTSLTGQQSSQAQGERGTVITIDTIGSGITALNGTYAAFKHSTEYFIAEVDTSNNRLKNVWRGVGFDSSDAWLSRTAMSDDDTITLMKLAWIFGLNNNSLDVTYNKPSVSYVAPTSPAIGDYWQDLSVGQWKKYSGTVWVNQSAVQLGLCIQDATNCKCARSFDFFSGLSTLNSMQLEYVDATNVRTNRLGSKVSVYGGVQSYDYDFVKWNTTSQADSGVTIGNSLTYWCYITDKGNQFFSNVQPYDRTFDLLGHYMPNKPWRCVGEFTTDGSANVVSTSVLFDRYFQYGQPDSYLATRSFYPGSANQILATSASGANASWVTQTRANLPSVTPVVSSGCGSYTTSSGTLATITNLSVTITTTGRPVWVVMQTLTNLSSSITLQSGSTGTAQIAILRGATNIGAYLYLNQDTSIPYVWPGGFSFLDVVVAGTSTYTLKASTNTGTTFSINNFVLLVYEI